jgi:hypothetical protein
MIAEAASSKSPFLIRSPRCGAARNVERMAESLWAQLAQLPKAHERDVLAKTA